MPYIITGTVTFSSQANRDAALARVNTAVSGLSVTNITTVFSPGINTPNTTSITFSLQDGADDQTASAIGTAILNALVASNRHTSGYLSVCRI